MNASGLKALHLQNSPDSHFFDRSTMAYFGDTMQNFGVRKSESGEWLLFRKRKTRAFAAGTGYLFGLNGEFMGVAD